MRTPAILIVSIAVAIAAYLLGRVHGYLVAVRCEGYSGIVFHVAERTYIDAPDGQDRLRVNNRVITAYCNTINEVDSERPACWPETLWCTFKHGEVNRKQREVLTEALARQAHPCPPELYALLGVPVPAAPPAPVAAPPPQPAASNPAADPSAHDRDSDLPPGIERW